MARRIVSAREQSEMLLPWSIHRTAMPWTPSPHDDGMEMRDHPSGLQAWTFPGQSGDVHHWHVMSPSGENVAKGRSSTPQEAQAAAVQVMDNPPRPYRYGPEDLEFGLYNDGFATGGGTAGVWSKGDLHGPENWLTGITWGPSGEIGHIETKEDHRRRGLATQLFDYVRQHHRPDLRHSPTLTDDGRAWSQYEQSRNAHRTASPWHSKEGDPTYSVPISELQRYRQFNPAIETPEDYFNSTWHATSFDEGLQKPSGFKRNRNEEGDYWDGGFWDDSGDEGSGESDLADAFASGAKLPPAEIVTNGVGAILGDGNHRVSVGDMMSQPNLDTYIYYDPHHYEDDDLETRVDPDSQIGKHIHDLVQNYPYKPIVTDGLHRPGKYVFRRHPETGEWQRGIHDPAEPSWIVDTPDYLKQMGESVPGFKDQGLGFYDNVDWGDGPEPTNRNLLHALRRLAASNPDFDPMAVTNKLKGEFYDWFDALPQDRLDELRNIEMHPFMEHHENNPVSHWPTVERFLKDKYPAAHRGFLTGREDASMWLDNPNNDYEDPMLEGDDEFGSLPPPEPYSSEDADKLGYDPQEVVAGMVLLHNRAHSGRQDSYLNSDKKRLVDIFNKRQQMQRDYEKRTPGVTARIAASDLDDIDDIYELLGIHDDIDSTPPAPPESHDPIPGVPQGWERYYKALVGQPDDTGTAHLHLPVDVLDHYKEYDRDPNTDQARALAKVISDDGGIRSPVHISTDGTHALMHEGNNRLALAKQMGITHLPVRVTYERPGRVVRNEGTPVPLEKTLGGWLDANKQHLTPFFEGG